MNTAASLVVSAHELSTRDDFNIGRIRVSPTSRTLGSAAGVQHLQPKVMLLLISLALTPGKVVTRRDLFGTCWPGGGVGDDSLNRAVKALRDALELVAPNEIIIETIPRTGYRLVMVAAARQRSERRQPAQDAFDCWRMGLPKPDLQTIEALEDLLHTGGGSAEEWGLLALLLRKAVEYAEADDCAKLVTRCEKAARHAYNLEAREPNASVALAGLTPLFGHWGTARSALLCVLNDEPAHPAALHDLAVLEMATGRASAAIPVIRKLIERDGLAATYQYKRMYHLWVLGDFVGAEQVAGRAIGLWPQHPAIWNARFWTLVFSGRAEQAERMTSTDDSTRILPPPLLQFLEATARCKSRRTTVEARRLHIRASLDFATKGPSQAVASLLALCALDGIDEAFEVAYGYYLGRGSAVAPLRSNGGDPSITDQHRRVTQPLFIPATRLMREDQRFEPLCADLGLRAYWEQYEISPD